MEDIWGECPYDKRGGRMKVERGVARTYEDLINNTTSELLWLDGKKVEEAELVITEGEEEE